MRLREVEVTSAMRGCDPIRKRKPDATGEPSSVAVGAPPCRLERFSIAWSSLCALHCAVPLLVTGAALVTGAHAHEHSHEGHASIQLPLAIASVIVAGWLLSRSYVHRHRDWRALALLGVGAVGLGLGQLVPWPTVGTAMVVTTAGFAAVLAAQVANVILVRRASACCAMRTEPRATPSP